MKPNSILSLSNIFEFSESIMLAYHYLIIGSYPDFSGMGGQGSGPGCGTDGLGQYKLPGIG